MNRRDSYAPGGCCRLTAFALAACGYATSAGCHRAPDIVANAAFNAAVEKATLPGVYGECVAALAHVRQCDGRFPDRGGVCSYSSGGECAPYINAEQSQCLREATCEMVRAAIDQRSWLCGMAAVAPGTGPLR